jgi:hypothetical protein
VPLHGKDASRRATWVIERGIAETYRVSATMAHVCDVTRVRQETSRTVL